MAVNKGRVGYLHKLLVISVFVTISSCASTGDQQAAAKLVPSIIAVATPGVEIPKGAKFAWLPKAVSLYRDERLDTETIQYHIEQNIRMNLADMGLQFVEQEQAADYTIAYTAALESSLDDATILQRYGLVPGNMRVPHDDPQFEKGTLLIYAFDAGTGDVVWRSAVQAAVDLSIKNQERKKRIETIVRGMFGSFPLKKS